MQDGVCRLPDLFITDKNDTFHMEARTYSSFRIMARAIQRDPFGNAIILDSIAPAVSDKIVVSGAGCPPISSLIHAPTPPISTSSSTHICTLNICVPPSVGFRSRPRGLSTTTASRSIHTSGTSSPSSSSLGALPRSACVTSRRTCRSPRLLQSKPVGQPGDQRLQSLSPAPYRFL